MDRRVKPGDDVERMEQDATLSREGDAAAP